MSQLTSDYSDYAWKYAKPGFVGSVMVKRFVTDFGDNPNNWPPGMANILLHQLITIMGHVDDNTDSIADSTRR